MASCITAQFGNTYCPQVRLTVTQTASTNTNVTLTWVLEYVAYGYAFYLGGRTYTAVINGQTKTGTFYPSGITATTEIARGTITVNKTTAKQNIAFSVSFPFNGSWNGVYAGTKSASGSIEVAAKPSYSIKYDANGGSGAPSSQTKWYGTNITLSSSKPTRTGYSFLGWATSATSSTAVYKAGATYSANASVTLYAVWKANTYSVKYDANGGTGAPATQTKTYGVTLVLSATKPTRTNYNFKGWGTSSASTTVAYEPGSNYTKNEAVTLYAIWEIAYIAPRITNISVDRCDSEGDLNEDGTFALVKFSWASDKDVVSVKIGYKLPSDSDFSEVTVSASGTSGNVSEVIGGSLDTEYRYNVHIVVSDSSGNSTFLVDLPAIAYTMDCLAGGKGVSFGKPAEQEGMDIAMDMLFRKGYTIKRELKDGTLVDLLYPIGSVYMSVDPTNPGDIFGGEWEQIVGRFLYCSTTSKDTGGSNTIDLSHMHNTYGHTLTINEIPSHQHTTSGSWGVEVTSGYKYTGTFNVNDNAKGLLTTKQNMKVGGGRSHSHGNTGTALSDETSIMPAYFTVYCWYRKA